MLLLSLLYCYRCLFQELCDIKINVNYILITTIDNIDKTSTMRMIATYIVMTTMSDNKDQDYQMTLELVSVIITAIVMMM